MYRKSWDVEEFIGQYAQVRIVDERSADWAHINFDDLRGDVICPPVWQMFDRKYLRRHGGIIKMWNKKSFPYYRDHLPGSGFFSLLVTQSCYHDCVLICKPLENNKRIPPHLFLIESVPNSSPIKNLVLFYRHFILPWTKTPGWRPIKIFKKVDLSFFYKFSRLYSERSHPPNSQIICWRTPLQLWRNLPKLLLI